MIYLINESAYYAINSVKISTKYLKTPLQLDIVELGQVSRSAVVLSSIVVNSIRSQHKELPVLQYLVSNYLTCLPQYERAFFFLLL